MSIWCSWEEIAGRVRAYAAGWSNHYPADADPPGTVAVAHIAPWCVPGWAHREDDLDWPQVGDWLRLDVDAPGARTWWTKDAAGNPAREPVHASIVLDVDAVRALRDDLTRWLECEHLTPKVEGEAT